ncbi:NACHT domain- and WD repeat-containing protein 1-like isoform X2 [Pecten maximus]|uniref:NACHT domain- and WD repeat-containing protein 1-like isoform X2 n=1 Tax=Pecten maximus TaxID=6579 RepID=UPI0014580B0E|nr:NACHT domain- and WD repeat-containing protein 1-like isoform X2 [Pecten maximus]
MDRKKSISVEKDTTSCVMCGKLDLLPPLPAKTLKVYICCNKSEFELERSRLWNDAVPYLQKFCVRHGLDLIWADVQHGRRTDHVMDSYGFFRHLSEIESTYKASIGPFFLCLFGNTYGDAPLPLALTPKEFQYLRKYAVDEGKDVSVLDKWYILDENAVPPQYYLQSFTDPFQRLAKRSDIVGAETEKDDIYRILLDIFTTAVKYGLSKSSKQQDIAKTLQRHLISGIEQQIQKAIHLSPEDCIFIERTIENSSEAENKAHPIFGAKESNERRQRYEELQNQINAAVPSANRFEFLIKFREEGITPQNCQDHAEYMDNFAGAVATRIKELAESYINKNTQCLKTSDQMFYNETLLHLHHCKALNLSLCDAAVEHQLVNVQKLLTFGAKNEHYAIMIKGPVNSGKSMFISKLCHKAREMFGKDTVLITRFVGLTTASTCCENILRAICSHLNQILQQNLSLKSYNMSKLRNYFHGLLNRISKGKRHIVLAVDSIDKMKVPKSETDPLVMLDWIVSKLPAKVHFFVSYDSCPLSPATQRLEDKAPASDHVIVFSDCTEDEIKSTIQFNLKSKMRSLSKEQEHFFRDLLPLNRTPMVTNLLLETAVRMPSHYMPGGLTSSISIDDLVLKRLTRLEQTLGVKLIRAVCRYITLAKDGLSEMEILDVLSCNNDVLLATIPTDLPKNLRFPFYKWLHVKEELGSLLCTRLIHGKYLLRWAHPNIQEIMRKKYLCQVDNICKAQVELADIFMDTWVRGKPLVDKERGVQMIDGASRYVCPQPLLYNEHQYNQRRIDMLWIQLLQSGSIPMLKEKTFCNFEYMLAMAHSKSADTLLDNLRLTTSNLLDADILMVSNTLNMSRVILSEDYLQLANELIGRVRHITEQYPDYLEPLVTQCMQWCDAYSQPLLIPLTTWLPSPFVPLATTIPDVWGCRVLTTVFSSQHVICTVRQKDIALYHVSTGKIVKAFTGHKGSVKCIHVCRGGRDFVSGDDEGVVRVWDTNAGQCTAVIREHTGDVNTVIVAANYDYVISGSDDTTVLICSYAGKKICVLKSHIKGVTSVRLNSSNSILASASRDKSIVLWSLEDLVKLGSITDGITSPITCMELTCDNTFLVVGCEDNSLHVLSFITGSWIHQLRGHEVGVTCIDVSNDCFHVVVGCLDGNVYLYNLRTTDLLQTLKGSSCDPVRDVCISRDDFFIFSATETKINVWNFYKKTMNKATENDHSGSVTCVYMDDQSRFALSGGEDGVLKMWNLELNEFKENLLGHSAGITCIAVSPDGSCCVTGSRDRTLLLWSLELLTWALSYKHHELMIQNVEYVDDERILSYDVQGNFHIWQAETGVTLTTYNIPAATFVLSSDGQYLVTSRGDQSGKIWRTNDGTMIGCVSHTERITCVARSVDDQYLVTASVDGSLKVWELATAKLTQVLVEEDCPVTAVALHTEVVSGSERGTVLVWDLSIGEPRHRLTGHTDCITTIRITSDGLFAISASRDHTIRLWSIRHGIQVTLLSMHIPVLNFMTTADAKRIIVHLENDHHVPLLCLHNSPVDPESNSEWAPSIADALVVLPLVPRHTFPHRNSGMFPVPKLPVKRKRSSVSSLPQMIKLSPIKGPPKSTPKSYRTRFRIPKIHRREQNADSKMSKMCVIV